MMLIACSGSSGAASTVTVTRAATVTTTEATTVVSASTVTKEVPTTVTATASSSKSANQTDPVAVGQPATSGGITMTVTSFKKVPSYKTDYNDDQADIGPKNGGQLIQVTANVKNKTKASIDLTCGFPVDARLVDDDDANYDPVDDLYKIAGNPGCNDNLQPGFSHQMTWVYEIPKTTKTSLFGFRDTDLDGGTQYPYALVTAPASAR